MSYFIFRYYFDLIFMIPFLSYTLFLCYIIIVSEVKFDYFDLKNKNSIKLKSIGFLLEIFYTSYQFIKIFFLQMIAEDNFLKYTSEINLLITCVLSPIVLQSQVKNHISFNYNYHLIYWSLRSINSCFLFSLELKFFFVVNINSKKKVYPL